MSREEEAFDLMLDRCAVVDLIEIFDGHWALGIGHWAFEASKRDNNSHWREVAAELSATGSCE